jgi:hypothetical protein
LCLAADEQFSAILPGGKWTMAQKGQTQVDLVALDDKRGITLFPGFTGDLTMLDPQFIYQGTTTQCHPDVNEYVEATEMRKNRVYGGSTEIETSSPTSQNTNSCLLRG